MAAVFTITTRYEESLSPGLTNCYLQVDSAIRPVEWNKAQPKILFPKSATFPRQSQKVEETEQTESGLYYLGGQQESFHHHQYNYNFHPYRGKNIQAPGSRLFQDFNLNILFSIYITREET